MTLDASSLYVCMKRMGVFATGRPLHRDLDTLLLAGNNPVVSHQGWSKSPLPSSNPRQAIAEGQAKGTRLIVIDPRLTVSRADYGTTTASKIPIFRCDDGSERCSGSSPKAKLNVSFPPTAPFTIPSISSVTSSHGRPCEPSEWRTSPTGTPHPLRPHDQVVCGKHSGRKT